MLLEDLRRQVVETGRKMVEYGLVAGTWGNISARDAQTGYFALTPSGMDYLQLAAEDIVIIDPEGHTVDGQRKPSSEIRLHVAIYRHRPDIMAIVHTHSVYGSTCACAGKAIPPLVEDLVQIAGGSVDIAPYALPGTDGVAANAVKALAGKFAVLLENHGAVGVGENLADAFTVCQLLEKSAQIYLFSQLIGGAKILPADDVKVMHQFYKDQYGQR
ncbi:MAG TPA: class II aldolase/adducin family protein [Negativicutes bacterium]|nr:class II aldolase/adducin family protein [Negativicutes bacterium]